MRKALYGGGASRYDTEMQKPRSFEAQTAFMESMFPDHGTRRDSPRRKEPESIVMAKRRKESGDWFGQDTSWMEDLSMGRAENKAGNKRGGRDPPSVLDMQLGKWSPAFVLFMQFDFL